MAYKIGIDVGGTFTDFLLMDDQGNTEIYKTSSTPLDPSVGTMTGLKQMADARGITLKQFLPQVSLIAHGTTITTNAVLTGKVAKTGLLTTKGHRDWLPLRRGLKNSTYNAKEDPPEPVVERHLRRPIEERVDKHGEELLPLNEQDVLDAANLFKAEGVEAVAVVYMHAFRNDAHEKRSKELLKQVLPNAYVCTSSEVLPQVRIYERGSTTVFNACVGPVLRSYLTELLKKLADEDFGGLLLIMQSNGGMMSPQVAMDFAVNTLLSGPAGGATSGMYFGSIHDCPNAITMDMGGTSFDVCLIRHSEPAITTELDVADFRMAAPSIAMHTIGAGGGSIAHVDETGIYRVGPQSAGAYPGPACYDTGGTEPTVTDNDVVLGFIDPDYFLGGCMQISPELSRQAVKSVADKLGLSVEEAAWGAYKIVNTNMAQAVRLTASQRGYDPRMALLVTAGGAGPVHAVNIAEELEAPMILVPKISSVFCASGMLISDIKHDFVRVAHMLLLPEHLDLGTLRERMNEIHQEASDVLSREDIPSEKRAAQWWADIRYEGQFNEIATPMPVNDWQFDASHLDELVANFNKRHDELFGYSLPGFPTELLSVRLTAIGVVDKPKFKESPFIGSDASAHIKGTRDVYWDGQWVRATVYDGVGMGHGNELVGMAIIEEPTTTIVVPPKWQVTCDRFSNYLMLREGADMGKALKLIRES